MQDAGGWKNVRIRDQPVTCLYEGDPERDDFCLLQVEDIDVTPVELGKDFDPGDEFLSFGFSNDDFYGAPIRGEITAFARCGKLGDQKLIRLETFSDAQRIEGGQSGAPVLIYKRGKYKVIGLIAASEDLNGGLAIPTSATNYREKLDHLFDQHQQIKFKPFISMGVLLIFVFSLTPLMRVPQKFLEDIKSCSSTKIDTYISKISSLIEKGNLDTALLHANNYVHECNNNSLVISKARVLIEKKDSIQAVSLLRDIIPKSSGADTTQARYYLGVALAASNDCSKALQEFVKIDDDVELKSRIYYSMGVCLYRLERWSESVERFKYLAGKKEEILNSKMEHTELFFFYRASLSYLSDIYAMLWYENSHTNIGVSYRNGFLNYYRLFIEETIEISQRKNALDGVNLDLIRGSVKAPEYIFIYKTREFKELLCKLYAQFGYSVPNNLKSSCENI